MVARTGVDSKNGGKYTDSEIWEVALTILGDLLNMNFLFGQMLDTKTIY